MHSTEFPKKQKKVEIKYNDSIKSLDRIQQIKHSLAIKQLGSLEKRGMIDSGLYISFMVSQISERKLQFNNIPIGDFDKIFNYLHRPQFGIGSSKPMNFASKFEYFINNTDLGQKYRVMLLDGLTGYIKDIARREKPAVEKI